METFLIYVLLVALIAAFTVMLLIRLGVTEYVQTHGSKFFAKMFSCTFCMCFWAAVICSMTLCIITGTLQMLFIPFFSTMLSRYLI